MPYVSTDNSRIYYGEYGNGQQSVVLLHGNNEDSSVFADFIPAFADRYKIYAFDSPYHGQSTSSAEISYLSFAREIACSIKLLGLAAPVVIGYSDGGIIGITIASERLTKLTSLIAIGANYHFSGLKASCIKAIEAEIIMLSGTKKRVAALMLDSPDMSPEQLSRVSIPTLIVAGERDLIKARHTKALARLIPEAKLSIIKGAGHFLLDNGNCFSSIDTFLLKIHTCNDENINKVF